MASKQSFGIMDDCYFVPRTQILQWINNLLNLGSGAVYCQIIDCIHPNLISMNKINWKARSDYEFINNLKLLQTGFKKKGIQRHIDVQKLARAKYQDNLQFIQWLKKYFDTNGGNRTGQGYNAEQRRGGVQVDFSFAQKNVVPKSYNGSGQIIPNQQPQRPIVNNNSHVQSSVSAYRNQSKPIVKRQNIVTSSSTTTNTKDKQKIKKLQSKIQQLKTIIQQNLSSDDKVMKIAQALGFSVSVTTITQQEQMLNE